MLTVLAHLIVYGALAGAALVAYAAWAYPACRQCGEATVTYRARLCPVCRDRLARVHPAGRHRETP